MKQKILDIISDLCSDFLYYDRKESETLSFEQLNESVKSGVITVDEMVFEFRKHLENTFADKSIHSKMPETTYQLLQLQEIDNLKKRVKQLESLINNPEVEDFTRGFKIEQAHQTERWGIVLEEQKPPHHYILVFNKLLGKLAVAIFDKDKEKFKHHLITLAASAYNCHRQIDKDGTEVNRWYKK